MFALADSLEPGTYVPILPFVDEYQFDRNPYEESEEKMRDIRERLRKKIGNYGSDGMTTL